MPKMPRNPTTPNSLYVYCTADFAKINQSHPHFLGDHPKAAVEDPPQKRVKTPTPTKRNNLSRRVSQNAVCVANFAPFLHFFLKTIFNISFFATHGGFLVWEGCRLPPRR
jgi:hypothetical protein